MSNGMEFIDPDPVGRCERCGEPVERRGDRFCFYHMVWQGRKETDGQTAEKEKDPRDADASGVI